jgi:putative lipoic acid-binding regulatory protein
VSATTDGKGQGQPPAPGQSPVLEYPLDYTFKVMGLAADDFPEHARRLVAAVVGDAPAERVTVRTSAQGKYHSVSVACLLASEAQRRAVYQALHDDPRVVYYL